MSSIYLRLLPVVVGVLGSASGCGDERSGYRTMGTVMPSATRVGANLVFADVALDGRPGGRLGVDTGSPVNLIDVTKFPGAILPRHPQVTADLTFGTFTVLDVPVLQIRTDNMDSLQFAGLLGGNVMRQFSVQFNYRDPDRGFRLGDGPPPDGVETPGASASFELEGGGLAGFEGVTVAFPATRVPISVEIDGVSRPFILDTGASETVVRSTVYGALTADGRAQLDGLPITTFSGPAVGRLARVRSMRVAGAEIPNSVIMSIGATGDALLDSLTDEVGHPVDGLLGGSFLREFLVTVDYPGRRLRLQRYSPPRQIADEFKRVGLELGPPSGPSYTIAVVYQGTDAAAKQLQPGDQVLTIDDQPLGGLDAITADERLNGTVGTIRRLGLGTSGTAALTNTTVEVLVEDLIPAP